MPSTDSIQIHQESYDTDDARLADSGVKRILTVLLPNSVLTASMGTGGACISARFSRIVNTAPDWDSRFFDLVIGNEIMLKKLHANKHLFTSVERHLVIPDQVHQPEYSKKLLQDIFHLQPEDHIGQQACRGDKAQLFYAYDNAVGEASVQYINFQPVLPVNLCLFMKTTRQPGYQISCVLEGEICYFALRENGRLLWHHSVEYSVAEDIIFHILNACRELNIPVESLHTEFTATYPDAEGLITQIEEYFPAGKGSQEKNRWSPVLSLLKQLDACVS